MWRAARPRRTGAVYGPSSARAAGPASPWNCPCAPGRHSRPGLVPAVFVFPHSLLTREQVGEMFARLAAENVQGRRRMLVEPQRAEVIVGGAAVLLTVLRELDIPELIVSESDILDGLAASLRGSGS
ncbi:hypothetical protein F0U63_46840 [Cystobacter fuscus]|nr:hypothetical protein F0U63_46840 [Cystobacter fuscus]